MKYFLFLNFASVEANLLYIQEENLTPEFQGKLCALFQSKLPLYIIIQLKILPSNFHPLMNKLTDIRKDKAIKKILNWEKYCHRKYPSVEVKVVENTKDLSDFSFDLEELKKLNVYYPKWDKKLFSSLLDNRLSALQVMIHHY